MQYAIGREEGLMLMRGELRELVVV